MNETHKSLFLRYRDDTVIQKALMYAHWTLPQLMADLQQASMTGVGVRVERDYQEMGALLVNNLAAKLASLLFPSSKPFYKIKLSPALKKRALSTGSSDIEVASGLSQLELASCQQLFLNASYEQLVMAVKHLIVTGNVLLYRDSDALKTTAYGIQAYSVRRDGRGTLMDCVLREYTDFESLPTSIQMILAAKFPSRYKAADFGKNRVELYTRIKREMRSGGVVYCVTQEADDVPVGTEGTYPDYLCPWQAVNWSLITGENYGRGLVEDYAGGFAKLSDQSLASTLYGIEVGRVINLVAPGMGADVDELQGAESGQFVSGQKDAITAYESGDALKLNAMEQIISSTFGRLAKAFMYKANTRDAERVTAYELKQDAMEAENTLGGVYSSLSASMQIPLAHVLLTEVNPGILEGIITKQVKLDIEAGIPALGRQADVQNLASAAQDAAAILPVFQQLMPNVDPDKVWGLILAGSSIDPASVSLSKDQIAQKAAAQAQAAQGQQQIQQSTTLADQSQLNKELQG